MKQKRNVASLLQTFRRELNRRQNGWGYPVDHRRAQTSWSLGEAGDEISDLCLSRDRLRGDSYVKRSKLGLIRLFGEYMVGNCEPWARVHAVRRHSLHATASATSEEQLPGCRNQKTARIKCELHLNISVFI
ncbi:unnamed protein product [Boreogadus saida]